MRLRFPLPVMAWALTCALLQAQTAPQKSAPSAARGISSAAASTPIPPARIAKIEEMLTLTGTKPSLIATIEQGRKRIAIYADQQAGILPPVPKDQEAKRKQITVAYEARMSTIAEAQLTWDKLKPSLIRYCADNFTDQQMDRIIVFYKSAAGKVMLEKGQELNQQTYSALISLQNQAKPLTDQATLEMQDKMKALGLRAKPEAPKVLTSDRATTSNEVTAK